MRQGGSTVGQPGRAWCSLPERRQPLGRCTPLLRRPGNCASGLHGTRHAICLQRAHAVHSSWRLRPDRRLGHAAAVGCRRLYQLVGGPSCGRAIAVSNARSLPHVWTSMQTRRRPLSSTRSRCCAAGEQPRHSCSLTRHRCANHAGSHYSGPRLCCWYRLCTHCNCRGCVCCQCGCMAVSLLLWRRRRLHPFTTCQL